MYGITLKTNFSIPKPTRKPETTLNAKLVSHNIGSHSRYRDGDVVNTVLEPLSRLGTDTPVKATKCFLVQLSMTTQTLEVYIEYIDIHKAGARFHLNPIR